MTVHLTFDTSHYVSLNKARMDFLSPWLPRLIQSFKLKTALDVGCGVGQFSSYLTSFGLKTVAVDVRPENLSEAQHRCPSVEFHTLDLEDSAILRLGRFDLVFCFGFLYHLEDPFRAIRHLYALTGKVLLIESRVVPGTDLKVQWVEECENPDQSLHYSALVPSQSCLTKMLYRAGFPVVSVAQALPNHEEFRAGRSSPPQRTVLITSSIPLDSVPFRWVPEPAAEDPWSSEKVSWIKKMARFLRRPWRQKVASLRIRRKRLWHGLFPKIPLPIRLPYGGWWLAQNDVCSDQILLGTYEEEEWRFVDRSLKEGMTFLDIGAHHGFFSILAAKRTGPSGRVIAFEPSERERRRLTAHVKLNRCRNVTIEPWALSSAVGESVLFVVQGRDTGCNSLRPPLVDEPTQRTQVRTTTLDRYLREEKISSVDFIKMDVEGAELEVLRGSEEVLCRNRRPVFLMEVQDRRTSPWGYSARVIYDFLSHRGYRWFYLRSGRLQVCPALDRYENNLVAIPEERTAPGQGFID